MNITIGHKLAEIWPIEWADSEHEKVVAFFIWCPKCKKKQWNRVSDCYQASDGTTNNLKCKACGLGKVRKRMYNSPEWDFKGLSVFSPKSAGWKSSFREPDQI